MPFSLEDAREEVRKGLDGGDKARRDRAYKARSFYERRNEEYLSARREEDALDFADRIKAYRLLAYQAVRALSRHLYNPGPVRQLEGAPSGVQEFLDEVYEANAINELMAEADRLASLGGACLIEAHATDLPEKPVKLYLYGADECRVWCEPEDPGKPVAVCTVQRLPDRSLRYDLWTDAIHDVYETDPPAKGSYAAAEDKGKSYVPSEPPKYRPELSGVNPYGVIPFAAAHDELPISSFFGCDGIGPALARANQAIDEKLSDLCESVSKFLCPPILARNVGSKFRFRWLRGLVQHLVADKDSILNPENGGEPDVFPVQAPVDIQAGWEDIDRFADSTLEDVGCPPGAVRLKETQTAPSGIAQLVASLPLRERALQRRGPFGRTERDLVRVILRVASAYPGGESLAPVADTAKLSLTWPSIPIPIPMPELDAADGWLMAQGLKSKTMVLQDRHGFTKDQAYAHLKQVAEDREVEAEILGEPELVGGYEDPATASKPPAGEEQPGEKPAEEEAEV